jgi:hypothetical protein
MAYQLGNTIYQGTVSGGGLIVSWVGMIGSSSLPSASP